MRIILLQLSLLLLVINLTAQNWECSIETDTNISIQNFYEPSENTQCDDYLYYIPGYLTHESQSKILTINLTVLVQYYDGDTMLYRF